MASENSSADNTPPEDPDALVRRVVAAAEKIAAALESIARELHVANGLKVGDP
jgi:hypothetical protein